MTLAAGTKLGPYEIVAPLGAGGMGEVYRARDTRLGREVAVKILPASLSADSDRLRRFEQEARTAGALNHPNILAIYDVGTHEGSPYLVSELLEGETLRQKLMEGSLPARRAVDYAVQIANGLACAHDKGIVHRDLKPENLFITTDGRVKILDFGLAKLLRPDVPAGEAPTVASAALETIPGTVMGTVGYMSPEQVRGQLADARSDIFSFGAILCEVLSGQRAFQRETAAETMTAILKEDPPEFSALGKNIAPSLERVVHHCLEKSPELRFQSAKDLAFALAALSGSESTTVSPVVRGLGRRRWPLWTAAAVAGAAALLALLLFLRPSAPAGRMQFAIPVPAAVSHLALSVDGRMLAYVAHDDASGENMVYIQPVGSPKASVLPGTEGASYPFWSPDDEYVAFFANGKLKKVAINGGSPQVLAEATTGRGGSWGSRGVIIYAPQAASTLWQVRADGTNPGPLTGKLLTAHESSHRWPLFLPDGDHFLFWGGNFEPGSGVSGIYASSLAASERKLLLPARSNLGYSAGQLSYVGDNRELMAVSFDPAHATVSGEPRVVAEGVAFQPSTYWGAFTVGGNGTVVYNSSSAASLSVLIWFDRTGKELGQVGQPGVMANPSISPDGNRAAVDIADLRANNVDVWLEDLRHDASSRFTFDPSEEVAGVWSRDGSMLAYRSNPNPVQLEVKQATGLEPSRTVTSVSSSGDNVPNSWTPEDKQILCSLQPVTGGSHLILVDVATGKQVPFLAGKASETNGQISPDGKWVAYASNESGDWEIYVTTFPNPAGKWQVSRGGGSEPRWRGDGREIFYIGPKGLLTAVPVNVTGTFSLGASSPLFQIHGRAPISSTDLFTYDVTKDGKRFLVNRYVKPEHVEPLTVVLNAVAGTTE